MFTRSRFALASSRSVCVAVFGACQTLAGCSLEVDEPTSEYREAGDQSSAPATSPASQNAVDTFPVEAEVGGGNDIFADLAPTEGGLGSGGASGADGLGSGDLTVLTIFDMSGSMANTWEGQSKWLSASTAFQNGLVGVEEELTIGALIFPGALGCDVPPLSSDAQIPFQKGTTFLSAWRDRIDESFPDGGTPLGAAFEQADHVIAEASELGLVGEGRRFRVFVITDGEPNCDTDPERLVYLAQTWREKGVEVHVMGLPGSIAAADLLNRLASEGGSAKYVPAVDVQTAEDTSYAICR